MRVKIDENLPVEAAEVLRSAGHDAATVSDQGIQGEGRVETWRGGDRIGE
jgi:predicted nuclease of predicted toxin-antitoxin system